MDLIHIYHKNVSRGAGGGLCLQPTTNKLPAPFPYVMIFLAPLGSTPERNSCVGLLELRT